MLEKRRASSATPTSDWLITAVGPPPWATRILWDMLPPSDATRSPDRSPGVPLKALGAARDARKTPAANRAQKPSDTVTRGEKRPRPARGPCQAASDRSDFPRAR